MASNSKITQSQFLHIAKLSRLTINPDEEFIADQLSQAVEYSAILNQLDTSNVEPTYQVNHKKNVLREDIILPSLSQTDALSQASSTYNGYFKTKPTIKK